MLWEYKIESRLRLFPPNINLIRKRVLNMKFLLLTIMFLSSAGIASAEEATQGAAGGVANFGLLIILFVIFYMLVIRPQSKKLGAHRDMVGALKDGDKVITNGGIHGTVTEVDDETVTISVADSTYIKFSREAVAINLTAESAVTPEVSK